MKVRYTEPAALDFEASVEYLLDHAPSLVADFADSIDEAVALLLERPYSGRRTDRPGVRRWYIRRFKHMIFYTIQGDEVVSFIFVTPRGAGRGKKNDKIRYTVGTARREARLATL